jgi:hypothetical protein
MGATKRKPGPFILLFVFFATTPLLGQLPTGSIVGTVYGWSGAAVPGAELVLKDTATGTPRTTSTSTAASYEFLELRPSEYDLGGRTATTNAAELLGKEKELGAVVVDKTAAQVR